MEIGGNMEPLRLGGEAFRVMRGREEVVEDEWNIGIFAVSRREKLFKGR